MASLAISALSTQAIQYSDQDLFLENGQPVKLGSTRTWYEGTFNIAEDGYNPTTHQVSSAVVMFAFGDDNDSAYEEVSVDLGLVEGAFGKQFNVLTLFGGDLKIGLVQDLSADGILNYKINMESGDFYLGYASLVAQATVRPQNAVPDGGATAALLGLGLLGLSVIRRKMRS